MSSDKASQMKMVHIFPIGAGPDKGTLSYFTAKPVAEGDTVQITIRGRKVLGIVEALEDIGDDRSSIRKSSFQLKKIDAVLGQTIHGGPLYKTAKLLSKYYLSHPGLVLSAITPAIFSDPSLKDIRPTAEKIAPNVATSDVTKATIKKFLTPTLIQTSKIDRIIYFKKLIREYFAKKESVAIILPTIQEAKEWRELLSKGIAEHTILFTGDENKKNQREVVLKAASSTHPLLLVGTFFAAILPVQKLGAIIVEHESSNLYETRRRPIIDKRIAAEVFAHVSGVACIFSDSLLEMTTSGRIKLGTANAVEKLSFRIPNKTPDIIDMSVKKPDQSGFRALSATALSLIKSTLDKDEQVFIFSFRKNYASTTVCKDCGEGVTCPTCGHALALLTDTERVFFCPRCNENKNTDITCSRCGSWHLVPLGVGIDRVKEELVEAGFGDTIARIDGRQKDLEMDLVAKEFINRKKRILLGTEAALNRLPENTDANTSGKIDLTIVASLDSLFAMPLYNAPERAGHLIMRLSEVSKKVVIQTRYPKEAILEGAKRGTFAEFADSEFEVRKSLEYPPFVRMISLTFTGLPAAAEKATKKLEELFAEYKPEFFEANEPHGRINVRMQMKIDPDLWPIIPKNENDTHDEDLYLKLASLPKAIKIDVE